MIRADEAEPSKSNVIAGIPNDEQKMSHKRSAQAQTGCHKQLLSVLYPVSAI